MGVKDSGGVCKPGWSTKVRSEDKVDQLMIQADNRKYITYMYHKLCGHGCVLADLGSVGVSEVGILFLLFSALLAGLLLQHTLHASFCFVSCNHSNPSVLVAGKSHSPAEILANTSTHHEKKTSF